MFGLSNRQMNAMVERERDYEACGRYSEHEEHLLESGSYMRDDYGCIIEEPDWCELTLEAIIKRDERRALGLPDLPITYDDMVHGDEDDDDDLPF